MASVDQIHPQNVSGPLYVDTSCIDCGTCYHLAPGIFEEARDDHSFVRLQPKSTHEWTQAKEAMVSCPTNSIGVQNPPVSFREAIISLPHLISDNVYYCGYTSRDSYGASSYLLECGHGNVMIDTPRFHPGLVKSIEEMGGLRTIILTHKDDVADHAKWAHHFGARRIIHAADVTSSTSEIEQQLKGEDDYQLSEDLLIIPVPGHTEGHVAILFKNEFLFTGDHLFYYNGELSSSKGLCWYDWDKQKESIRKLLKYDFEWVLPGHSGWGRFDAREMKEKLSALISRLTGTR